MTDVGRLAHSTQVHGRGTATLRHLRNGAFALVIVLLAAMAPVAHAFPALQLYSPDAVYINETWVITSDTFELWVVAATSGPQNTIVPIMDVTLAASFYGSTGTFSIAENP